MPNRREPLNLVDFTGGLNLRENTFQLKDNESPEMHNVAIDPLGGIYSRRGWERWNVDDIVDPEATVWDPRRAFLQQLSDGTDIVYIANKEGSGNVYKADGSSAFSSLALTCAARPHLVDFVAWGNYCFMARGRDLQIARRNGLTAPTLLVPAGASTWNNDYTLPGAFGTVAPQAELAEAHAGYLFVANITEDAVAFPNRVRWSHPTSPTDWAHDDFIDIDIGGNRITALMSYEDHLLIFKSDSIWALYGYDLDSWQLVQKSSTIGAISPQHVTRNEQAVFFHSQSDRSSIYAYTGERPMEISEQLRYVFENLSNPELIWVGWLDRKLAVTVPWHFVVADPVGPAARIGEPTTDSAGLFVYDPSVGEKGAWAFHHSSEGALGPLCGGSNIDTLSHPLAVLRATEHPCIVQLNARDDANDLVSHIAVLGGTGPDSYIITGAGEEIIMSGMPGLAPFHTRYKTPFLNAGWPARKKSWRRPDFVCRDTGVNHSFRVTSFRDYEETTPKRQYTVEIAAGSGLTVWGEFDWKRGLGENHDQLAPDGSLWGAGNRKGGMIRRGSSFGLCRSLQLMIEGGTPGAAWGIDAIVLKIVMRRFR